jgi:thiosulfate dehydrogenase
LLSAPPTEENLTAGLALYEKNCQVCHGGSDGAASSIARGLAPNAPQLAKDGVADDPEGETYWRIAHGIRFTAMPVFRETLSDGEIWQIVEVSAIGLGCMDMSYGSASDK